MSNELMTLQDVMEMGKVFYASGMFTDVKSAAQAAVKIQAGAELGILPFAAMTGINIIQGKPGLGAGLIAGKIKGSGKYDYRVTKMDNDGCVVEFYQGRTKLGESSFTMADAKAAGLEKNPTWGKFPRNMMFARAISNGARWYTPDIFNGSVYTAEELGGNDDVMDVSFQVVEEPRQAPAQIEQADPQPEPQGWIYDAATRANFWAMTAGMGLTHADVHAALKVPSMKEWAGSFEQAIAICEAASLESAVKDLWDDDDPGDAPEDDAPLRP